MIGSAMTSHAFGRKTASPANAAGTASVSVKKYSSTPGVVEKIPVPSEPAPKPSSVRRDNRARRTEPAAASIVPISVAAVSMERDVEAHPV